MKSFPFKLDSAFIPIVGRSLLFKMISVPQEATFSAYFHSYKLIVLFDPNVPVIPSLVLYSLSDSILCFCFLLNQNSFELPL